MHNYGHWKKTLALLVMSALSLGASNVDAMPEGGVVRSGSGSVTQNGKEMTIRQDSGRLAMDWTGFSVGKDETVRFQQPGKDALALNRVTGNQQSVIDGSLLSNGHVLLVNPNGVVIGKNASIDVGGLVASTAQVKDNFMKEFGNSTGAFSLGGVSDGKIINEGTIKAEGGLVALHAAKVENSGTISNTGGSAVLAAADTLTLTPDADGKLNFTVDGKAAEASALNKGAITADGGTIVMTADSASDVMSTVVNNSGTLQARTLRKNEKGQIFLEGGDKGQVEVSGTLDASGTEEGQSAGNIKVIGEKTIVHDGTNLLARGNVDGGKIETSGDVLNLGDNLNIDAKGVNGKAGEWLLDPLDVYICDEDPTKTYDSKETDIKKYETDGSLTRSTSIGYNDPAATDANASSVNSAVTWISTAMVENMLNAGTSVTIQAAATNGNANIIVSSNIDKTLGNDATLTLDAMRNITVNGNISSTSNKLNVILNADSNGDQIGAVIINANINTNGGDFTSASGGTVTYTSDEAKTKGYDKGTLSGDPDHKGHTVGTYFGHVDSSGTADGEKDDRLIQTNGGKITLNGEIAIGLNGGTLTLDSGGGAVTATGIINSGNSYGAYVYGTDTWNTLVEKTVEEYLEKGTVPAYRYQGVNYVKDGSGNYVKNEDGTYQYTTVAQSFNNGQPHYTFSEANTQNVRWLGDGSSTSVSTSKGTGYASVVITKGSMTLEQWLNYQLTYNAANFAKRYISQSSGVKVVTATSGGKTTTSVQNSAGKTMTTADLKTYLAAAVKSFTNGTASTDTTLNGQTLYANIKDDISHLLATNWFASKELAQGNTKGGSAAGDSYLATITTILENSLTTPNGQQILWAGGRGSGVLNKKGSNNSTNDKLYPYSFYGMPDDPTYQDGMYWVTGPEGEANNNKGTQFYSNAGSNWKKGIYGKTVYGYANWDSYAEGKNTTRYQPDNSAPFLTVGFGTTGKWDDAAMGGDTTVGFIKETNLPNSSLNIKAGSGTVSLEGDLGRAKALDTVNIESTGAVTLGNPNNTATTYHNGTVYADHGVYISGSTVSVGGEIHSGTTDKTASASTITTRSDGYQNTAFQLDSVTIKSAGDLTVHGVESDGYTGSDGNLKGGKISLTSTGKTGTITLGAGVDYNGDATDGTLAAASTAEGAVVVDAQGSQGSLVNSTTGTNAITTGKDVTTGKYGTWQVYVASPSDYGTVLGDNLNSETNAQWSSESTKHSATDDPDKNAAGKDIGTYTDHTQNKFIFQVTPTITVSGQDMTKIYGDTLSDEDLRGKLTITSATFKASDDTSAHSVDDYSKNFQEASDKSAYIASTKDATDTGLKNISVSSEAQAATATRTDGYKDPTGGTIKSTYHFNVDKENATGLNGYDLATQNADIEILRKTLTISTDGTQTYGNTAVTNGTPSYDKTQLANGDTLGDIQYTIATDGSYADSKGSNDTAHVGSYAKQYLTSSAEIKASDGSDASANYAVTGSGTITVNPADLYLTVGDVFTTYGTAFNTKDYKYSIDTTKSDGLVNGDTQASVLGDKFLNYTNTGAKTDASNDKVKTQNAGSYELQGAASKNLSDYTVHITNGKSTVNKATLTVNPEDIHRIYGQAAEVQEDAKTAYNLSGFANGDTKDTVDKEGKTIDQLVTVTNDVSKALKDDTHTQNASTVGYDMGTTATGDLTNYNIVIGDPKKVYLDKAKLTVSVNDTRTTYGQNQWTPYTYTLEGNVNGDTAEDVENNKISVKYTNGGEKSDASNDAVKTQAAGEYALTGEFTLSGDTDTNYEIDRDKSKLTGKATVNKADLTLTLKDVSTTYGNEFDGKTYGYKKDAADLQGLTNGDAATAITDVLQDSDFTYVNGGAKSDPNNENVKTQDAGSYQITGSTTKPLDNYNIKVVNPGNSTVSKKAITVENEMNQIYGEKDSTTFSEIVRPDLVNGDKLDTTKGSKFTISLSEDPNTPYNQNRKNRDTADVGEYADSLKYSGGGIVHNDGTDAYKNYDVTIKGIAKVHPKDIYTEVNGKGSTLNDLTWTIVKDPKDQMVNGDSVEFTYTPGNLISYDNQTFDVNSFINGTQIYDSTTDVPRYGKNYIFHSKGIVQLTFNPIVKPDVWAHSGGYRPRNKIETSLPVFRVEDAKVGQYGTYGVEHNEEGDKLVLSATGMRLPEPDQVPDEERTFTTTLSTETGSGTFKLVYNGVSLKVYPQDKEAEETVRAGDKTKNVSLSEKALYVGYTEMGLDLIDLKGVYIYFN